MSNKLQTIIVEREPQCFAQSKQAVPIVKYKNVSNVFSFKGSRTFTLEDNLNSIYVRRLKRQHGFEMGNF